MVTKIIFPIIITPAAIIITRNGNHNHYNTNRRALTHIIHNNNNNCATTVDFNNGCIHTRPGDLWQCKYVHNTTNHTFYYF